MNRLAVIYRRVSTGKQDASLENQESLTGIYLQNLGVPLLREYSDPDTSGTIAMRHRKGAREMLDFIFDRAHGVTDLAVTFQDRLGRNALDQISTVLDIWKAGVTPHLVCEGGAIPRTDSNELTWNIKAVIAQDMVNRIRTNVKVGLNGKRTRGELCGTPTFGWDAIETGHVTSKGVRIRRLVDNAVEQSWILKMTAWRAAGWSYGAIARELNTAGVKTKQAGRTIRYHDENSDRFVAGTSITASGTWQQGNVHKVLTNATVAAWLALQKSAHAA